MLVLNSTDGLPGTRAGLIREKEWFLAAYAPDSSLIAWMLEKELATMPRGYERLISHRQLNEPYATTYFHSQRRRGKYASYTGVRTGAHRQLRRAAARASVFRANEFRSLEPALRLMCRFYQIFSALLVSFYILTPRHGEYVMRARAARDFRIQARVLVFNNEVNRD